MGYQVSEVGAIQSLQSPSSLSQSLQLNMDPNANNIAVIASHGAPPHQGYPYGAYYGVDEYGGNPAWTGRQDVYKAIENSGISNVVDISCENCTVPSNLNVIRGGDGLNYTDQPQKFLADAIKKGQADTFGELQKFAAENPNYRVNVDTKNPNQKMIENDPNAKPDIAGPNQNKASSAGAPLDCCVVITPGEDDSYGPVYAEEGVAKFDYSDFVDIFGNKAREVEDRLNYKLRSALNKGLGHLIKLPKGENISHAGQQSLTNKQLAEKEMAHCATVTWVTGEDRKPSRSQAEEYLQSLSGKRPGYTVPKGKMQPGVYFKKQITTDSNGQNVLVQDDCSFEPKTKEEAQKITQDHPNKPPKKPADTVQKQDVPQQNTLFPPAEQYIQEIVPMIIKIFSFI